MDYKVIVDTTNNLVLAVCNATGFSQSANGKQYFDLDDDGNKRTRLVLGSAIAIVFDFAGMPPTNLMEKGCRYRFVDGMFVAV